MHLRDKFRIRVPAVITTYDYIYDTKFDLKMGAYYRDNIEQFERKIQTGASIEFDDPALLRKQKAEKQLHSKKEKIVRDLKQSLEDGGGNDDGTATTTTNDTSQAQPPKIPAPSSKVSEIDFLIEGPKALMIRYVIGHLMKHGFVRLFYLLSQQH